MGQARDTLVATAARRARYRRRDCPINEQHGPIPDVPGEVRHPTPEVVDERDLKHDPAPDVVIGQTPADAFKRYGELNIAGNIAVVDDGRIVQ